MQKNTRKYLRVIALATGSLLWMTENTLLTNSSTFRIFSRCFSLSCVTFSTQSRRKLFLIWQGWNYRFITFHSAQIFKYISIPDTCYAMACTFHNRNRTEAQQSIVLDKYYYSEIFDHCNWPIRRKYSREPCKNSIYTASKLIDMNYLYLMRLIITRVWRCLPVSGRQSWWGWERDTSERVWGKGPQLHIARPAYKTLNL